MTHEASYAMTTSGRSATLDSFRSLVALLQDDQMYMALGMPPRAVIVTRPARLHAADNISKSQGPLSVYLSPMSGALSDARLGTGHL